MRTRILVVFILVSAILLMRGARRRALSTDDQYILLQEKIDSSTLPAAARAELREQVSHEQRSRGHR